MELVSVMRKLMPGAPILNNHAKAAVYALAQYQQRRELIVRPQLDQIKRTCIERLILSMKLTKLLLQSFH